MRGRPPATRPRVGRAGDELEQLLRAALGLAPVGAEAQLDRAERRARSRSARRGRSTGTLYWSSVWVAVGAVGVDRGEAVGEIADLDIGERREGQAAAADQPQRGVGAARLDLAEGGAALALVGEGGDIGLQLDRRPTSGATARSARLAWRRATARSAGPRWPATTGMKPSPRAKAAETADEAAAEPRAIAGEGVDAVAAAISEAGGEALDLVRRGAFQLDRAGERARAVAPVPPPRTTRIRPSRRGS